jgi:uncharacterized protein DUF4242
MTRYLIERVWDEIEEEEQRMKGAVSKRILGEDRFDDVTWEHSHVVMDDEGKLKTYCVYDSPNTELLHEHADRLGDHTIKGIYEIGGDISPEDFPED